MAIQPTPPIQLDPSMDRGHELAFINQNFNNIANVLGRNSLILVDSGDVTVNKPANTLNASSFVASQVVFPSEPLFIYFCSNSNSLSSTGPYGQYSLGTNTVVQTSGTDAGKIALLTNADMSLFDSSTGLADMAFTVYGPNNGVSNFYYLNSVYINFKWFLIQPTTS